MPGIMSEGSGAGSGPSKQYREEADGHSQPFGIAGDGEQPASAPFRIRTSTAAAGEESNRYAAASSTLSRPAQQSPPLLRSTRAWVTCHPFSSRQRRLLAPVSDAAR
jgi:hypothetical protein